MNIKEKFDSETDWRRKALLVELFHLTTMIKDPQWNVRKTATAFNKSIGFVSESINIAEALRQGMLNGCESRNKALKLIRSK